MEAMASGTTNVTARPEALNRSAERPVRIADDVGTSREQPDMDNITGARRIAM